MAEEQQAARSYEERLESFNPLLLAAGPPRYVWPDGVGTRRNDPHWMKFLGGFVDTSRYRLQQLETSAANELR